MNEQMLNALKRYIEASNKLAIERAFGRDTLYESIEENAAWEALLQAVNSPGITPA